MNIFRDKSYDSTSPYWISSCKESEVILMQKIPYRKNINVDITAP